MTIAIAPESLDATPPLVACPGSDAGSVAGLPGVAGVPVPAARRGARFRAAAHALRRAASGWMVGARRVAAAHPVAAAGTVMVLAAALVPTPSLRGAVDGAPVVGVRLATPAAYVALSPLARAADALCLLSTAQHIALAATLLAVAGAWRVVRRCPHASALRTCARASGACGASLVLLVVVLAAAVFAPRPMTRLEVADADWVRVDFHTHTSASHDVPAWFTPAHRRAWHAAAGFDVAYVSDHKSVAGARAAAQANPARAGDGLVVLPALESWWRGVHLVVLGPTAADPALLADDQLDRALTAALASGRVARAPVAIAAIPDDLLRALTPAALGTAPWIRALEVVDGAPRAIAQRDREGPALAARAAAAGLVPLAGTNHHGWGRTAVAWNLVRVPGWRAMTPAALGERLEDVLRRGDAGAVRVAARARPAAAPAGARRALSLAATLPALAWGTARELGGAERVVWLAWLWGPAGVAVLVGRRVDRSRSFVANGVAARSARRA